MNFLIVLLLIVAATQADNSALQDFIDGNNLFAADIYKEMKNGKEENLLVSPYSAESVLALLHSGSRGETAAELRKALHLPEGKDRIEAGVKDSLPLVKGTSSYTLRTANKLYLKNRLDVRYGFHKSATQNFRAEVGNVDFANNIEAAKVMNKWVEEKTNNKIKNLIEPESINGDTKAVLINALYFQGNWSASFDKYTTRKQLFYKSKEDVIEANMMHQTGHQYNYHECSIVSAKYLELPFEGGEISMVIVLPNEKNGLPAIEDQMEKVLATRNYTLTNLNVALPKFKIESTIGLKDILMRLGVLKIFDGEGTDLSGIAGKPGELFVTEVKQKTFINVDENGVEAAAATKAGVGSQMLPIKAPMDFIVDHPFIFYIKAKELVLFAGRVLSPSQ